MKITINENERGFLFRNGVYKRILEPGRQKVRPMFCETFVKVKAHGIIDLSEMNLPALRKDAAFERSAVTVDVPDDRLAVHFADGRIAGVLKPGTYAFWNTLKKHTFVIIDITEPESAAKLPFSWITYMPPNSYIRFDVGEGEVGLLFYNGVFQKPLKAGVYYFWNYHIKVTVQTVDTRVQQLEVSGQEILTADKVSLCVNFVCSYSIVDPISVVVRLKDYQNQIHVLVQIMLREFAGKYRFDELLQQKDSIGGFVLEKLREREGELFIRFSDAGVKDMVFPGEIRDIMNTVLIAENSTLLKLKELEYLERICEKIGSISVDAGGSILSGLRELVAEI